MGSLNIGNFIWNIAGDALRDVYVLDKYSRFNQVHPAERIVLLEMGQSGARAGTT